MPQVLKEAVRARIVAASREAFAEHGYDGATMPGIAARARVATAGLYRYFPSKEALFAVAVPDGVVKRLDALLARRLTTLTALVGRPPHPGMNEAAVELLAFFVAHRLETVILLEGAAGTRHARWGERFVDRLVAHGLRSLREKHPRLKLHPPAMLVLRTLFENTRRVLARILATQRSEEDIREAIQAFWSYQLPGLAGFAEWAAGDGVRARSLRGNPAQATAERRPVPR